MNAGPLRGPGILGALNKYCKYHYEVKLRESLPNHGEDGVEVVDVVGRGLRRALLLDGRHVAGRGVRHAAAAAREQTLGRASRPPARRRAIHTGCWRGWRRRCPAGRGWPAGRAGRARGTPGAATPPPPPRSPAWPRCRPPSPAHRSDGCSTRGRETRSRVRAMTHLRLEFLGQDGLALEVLEVGSHLGRAQRALACPQLRTQHDTSHFSTQIL